MFFLFSILIPAWQESVMHPSEILTQSVGNQCFLTSRDSSPLQLCHSSCEYCFMMIHCVHIRIIILDLHLLSFTFLEVYLQGLLASPVFSEKPLFVRTVLVSTCRCIRKNVRIYRTAERLKRHRHQKQKLKKKNQQTEIK